MNYKEFRETLYEEEQRAFRGWDFSHLASRWHHEPMGWDYRAIVSRHLRPSHQLLDMGTGGGEFLLTLNHPHENTTATESYKPNIKLCMEKLVPLHIRICPLQDQSPLPFPGNSFDTVINRHSAYDLNEVARVLKPDGRFITQQVGGEDCEVLARRITPDYKPKYKGFSLSTELPKFLSSGFSVLHSDESHPELRFYDIGAIVFWAKTIEWTFPNFSVDNNFAQLRSLQDELTEKGFVSAVQHRFIIVASNSK